MKDVNPYSSPNTPLIEENRSPPKKYLNPWFSMWLQPRATIQQIIDDDPVHLVIGLTCMTSVLTRIKDARLYNMAEYMGLMSLLGVCIVVGCVLGVILLYIGAPFIQWVGKWFGGRGSQDEIRAAIAWSCIPALWGALLIMLEMMLYGREMFLGAEARDYNLVDLKVRAAFSVAHGIIGIWGYVAFTKALAQVQGYSAWKAVGNMAIVLLVCSPPAIAVGYYLGSIAHQFN
ncbi:Yip1 family protein [Hahella sp. NBU794]|uniref:Yip1 family protein n=1 Tax=Hahella sp. NBU794 TaxID=3422590 RepID=UPI003D6E54EA